MYIEKIELINFRNYENLFLEFVPGVNILTGDNAQGKTNILESLFFCAFGRSHRTSRDSEMFLFNSPFTRIQMEVSKERLDRKINISFREGKKFIEVNGKRLQKMEELFGNLNVVMFSPEDLKVVKETPGIRRKFLDMEISALDRMYYHNLVSYSRVLKERNNLLKMRNMDTDILDVYDEKLAQYGSEVARKRLSYLEELNGFAREIHRDITDGSEKIEFTYRPTYPVKNSIKENILESLRKSRQNDLFKQSTTVGPHRDDFTILINGNEARHFGSQGQQRTAILTLKFASLRIIRRTTGEYPVLLLDDVLSELDLNRQSYILSSIDDIQTIITMTGYENIDRRVLDDARIFYVSDGHVTYKESESDIES